MENPNECCVCYKDMEHRVILKCKHEFCLQCSFNITSEEEFRCPMCRIDYEINLTQVRSARYVDWNEWVGIMNREQDQ